MYSSSFTKMTFVKIVETKEGTFKVPHQRAQQVAKDQNKVPIDYYRSFTKDFEHTSITQYHQDSISHSDHRLSGEKDIDKNLNHEIDNNQFIENSESMPLFLPNSDAVVSRRNICSSSSDHSGTQGKCEKYICYYLQ